MLLQCLFFLTVLVGLANLTGSDDVVDVSVDASPVQAGSCTKFAFVIALVSCMNGVQDAFSYRLWDDHSVTFQDYAILH